MGRRRRSSVWEYYWEEEEGHPRGSGRRRSAKCKICDAVISAVDGSTSGLLRHLSFRHNHKVEGGVGVVGHSHAGDLEGVLERLGKEWEESGLKKKEKIEPEPENSGTSTSVMAPSGDPPDEPVPKRKRKRETIRRKKNSVFWEFYISMGDGAEAKCRICDARIKTTGGTTSGLSRHLLSIHKADAGNLGQLRKELRLIKNGKADGYDDSEDEDDSENIGEDDGEGPKPKVIKIRINDTQLDSDHAVEDEDDGGGGEDFAEAMEAETGDCDMEEDTNDPLWEEESEEDVTTEIGSGQLQLDNSTCFICQTSFDRKSKSAPHSSQEEYRFLFMEMLEIPTRKSIDYLEQLEGPEEWIPLCSPCQTLVVEGLSVRKQIVRLQFQLEECQKRILKKVKSESRKGTELLGKEIKNYPKQQRQVMEGIKDFVHSRTYSVLQCDNQQDQKPSSSTPGGSQVLYCGLCDDDNSKSYRSAELLAAHTKKVHQPSKKEQVKLVKGKKKSRLISSKLVPSNRFGYDCPNCPKVKDYPVAKYVRHLSIHQRKPYQCIACFEFLPQDESLREGHWSEKHPDIQHPPDTNKFIRIKFHPGRIWKCESCLEGFYSEEDRDQHELSCDPPEKQEQNLLDMKAHQCSSCQLRFRNIDEWRLHRVLHHPEVDAMCCPLCDLSFCETTVEGVAVRHDKKMVDHMASIHKTMRLYDDCEYCGLVFETGFDKKDHVMEKHGIPGNKVFPCGVCNLQVSSVQGLRKHMSLVHFEMDASICYTCGKKFLDREALLHHDFIYHGNIPEGSEVLQCPEEGCTYKAIIKRRLDHHITMAHEYERNRPFICRYCGKGFKQTVALKNHEEIHRNKDKDSRPYQCDQCGASFTLMLYLRGHKRGAHGVGRNGLCYRKRLNKAQGWRSRSHRNSSTEAFPSTDILF